MANDSHPADALGFLFIGFLGLLAVGTLGTALGGPSPAAKRADDTPPADPRAATDWFLRQLNGGTRYEESASRTRQLLRQLRKEGE